MQPSTTPFRETTNDSCCDCGADLQGNRLRCPACVQAAERVVAQVEQERGPDGPRQVIRPSDVARAKG